ncbi:Fungal family of unknown function (DUF1776), partial [Gilliamella apicola SCGC AB-598-B02]
CAFLRKTSSDQIFYLCISFICTIASIFLIPSLSYALSSCNSKTVYFLLLTFLFCFILVLYLMIPELYQNLFTRKGSPIIFNRKTNKVYINESY